MTRGYTVIELIVTIVILCVTVLGVGMTGFILYALGKIADIF